MTPNDPQLRVDTIDHYLPRLSESSVETADVWIAPERVWVPADELPTVTDFAPKIAVGGTCDWGECDQWAISRRWSDRHGWLPVCILHRSVVQWKCRPLRAGDRVPLVTDCPDCCGHQWMLEPGPDDPDGVHCDGCKRGDNGLVRVGSATVTEIRPVFGWRGDEDVDDFDVYPCIEMVGGGCEVDAGGILIDSAEHPGPYDTVPGDWSSACFGVRLSDVEVTSRMMESRWPLKPGTLTHDPADVSPVEDER